MYYGKPSIEHAAMTDDSDPQTWILSDFLVAGTCRFIEATFVVDRCVVYKSLNSACPKAINTLVTRITILHHESAVRDATGGACCSFNWCVLGVPQLVPIQHIKDNRIDKRSEIAL
jgi:hypothetical protein